MLDVVSNLLYGNTYLKCGQSSQSTIIKKFQVEVDLHQNFWGSENNILKIYIFNITMTNSIKMNT